MWENNRSQLHHHHYGVPPAEDVTALQASVVAFPSLLTRKLVLMQWKSDKPPLVIHWVKEAFTLPLLEKLWYGSVGFQIMF